MDASSVIHVDFVAQSAHGLPGRLGLTAAPGRWRPGRDSASDRLLEEDLERLWDHYQTRVLVTLLEEFEMKKLAIPMLREVAVRAGLESLWLPVADVSVPMSMESTTYLVDQVVARMSGGDTVVIHCRGGLGRSGTIAACCLVACGKKSATAIRLVRAARPGAVEVEAQERFVAGFAEMKALGERPG